LKVLFNIAFYMTCKVSVVLAHGHAGGLPVGTSIGAP